MKRARFTEGQIIAVLIAGSDQPGDRRFSRRSTGVANSSARPVYPVVFFDALRVKIRDEGMVKNKAVYVALALNPDDVVLGLWIEQIEGSTFWLKVITELKMRVSAISGHRFR